ncbi:Peptidase family M48 [Duganella sp. CF458]|uniref:M48 family metallopeptidase n=1 Tax=Duganella sp. CF458 TaxID=1884368 RepID=UPI0008ECA613|nr:M48 family metallopeptidase [Duganella sp. CF458]SFF54587.1 Peptidase family M48 [Duganella sp. CF458]
MQSLAVPDLINLCAPGRRRALRHWRLAALVAAVCLVLCAGWQLARPVIVDQLAAAFPPALEIQLGQDMLRQLDLQALKPSELSETHRARIGAAFNSLQAPHEGAPRHRLLFRSSQLGAAAFTLPSGDIILTDSLVLALPDDGAVLAVLAHELGHQQQHHMLRRLAQEAMLPAAAGVVLGDTSWLVSSMAARAPHLDWPQQTEIEADKYAADLLEHNGLSLRLLSEVQEALSGATGMAGAERAYLSIHPPCAERLAQQRERSAL